MSRSRLHPVIMKLCDTVGRVEEVGGAGCTPPGMYNRAQSHRRVGDNTFLANGVAEPPHSLPFKPSSFHSVEAV